MLMPIVSMNKMSMNESVAASCCWRHVLGVHEQFAEILHGGKLGTSYDIVKKVKDDYKDKLKAGWDEIPYDFGTKFTSQSVSWHPDMNEGAGAWVYGENDKEITAAFKATYGTACDHKDGSCAYYDYVGSYKQNQHLDATSAHAGIKNWDKPHDAEQYSS